jgi:hypothetical protein
VKYRVADGRVLEEEAAESKEDDRAGERGLQVTSLRSSPCFRRRIVRH